MKTSNSIPAVALVLGALLAAPVTASISTGNLGVDVQSALGSGGSVNVTLEDGVATLSGHVDGVSTKTRVRRAALANDRVERVVDLIMY